MSESDALLVAAACEAEPGQIPANFSGTICADHLLLPAGAAVVAVHVAGPHIFQCRLTVQVLGAGVQVEDLQQAAEEAEFAYRYLGHALDLAEKTKEREGTEIAFTGFPIGMALGLYPVTHRGIVSAISGEGNA